MSPGHSKYNYHNRMTLHGNDIAREWVKVTVSGVSLDTTAGRCSPPAVANSRSSYTCYIETCQWTGRDFWTTPDLSVWEPAPKEDHTVGPSPSTSSTKGTARAHGYCLFPVAFREEVKREKARAEAESEKETAEPKGEEVSVAAKSEQPNMGTVQSSEVQMGALEGEHSV